MIYLHDVNLSKMRMYKTDNAQMRDESFILKCRNGES